MVLNVARKYYRGFNTIVLIKVKEAKGSKINVNKTKVMVSGENCGDVERTGKWPCAVCGKCTRSDSV